MAKPTTIVWLRQDLRLADNPALAAAAARGGAVVPVYIWAPNEEGDWAPGAASRWWLHHSLQALSADLADLGSRLVLRRGETLAALRAVARQTKADAVYWNRRYEPLAIERDTELKETLRGRGFAVESFNASLLHEPWQIEKGTGGPYQVFTPFYKACLEAGEIDPPEPAPKDLTPPPEWPCSLDLADIKLLPQPDWAGGIRDAWAPGESGTYAALQRFVDNALDDYQEGRNRPDLDGSSRLSPYLHFGEISPRAVWHAARDRWARSRSPSTRESADTFLSELIWREFAHHLLYHFPHTPQSPLREQFRHFPWASGGRQLKAWQQGQTGFPLVDAGMRQLWTTGWMHNRVRMVVASFLVKDLRIPWQEGARWFWDTLVDADLANNTLGWQWTAGCGADAAPFFRIFNPVSQGQRHDPQGNYVRRWVPELAELPDRYVHCPWEADEATLGDAGVRLGSNYPKRIVDHGEARKDALRAYEEVKSKR